MCRLLRVTADDNADLETICSDSRVVALLHGMGGVGERLEAQQIRSLLASCAQSSHMPAPLWDTVSVEVVRALGDLPDMHAVHVALLMAQLNLRLPDGAMELAEQLEQRAPALSATGLTGVVVALSQLGPWPTPVGEEVAEHLAGKLDQLSLNELSASALACAMLGVKDMRYWQMTHQVLLSNVQHMMPRHLADTLVATATTQLFPITLLEELQGRLGAVEEIFTEEALSCAWALCAMRLFPKSFHVLLDALLTATCTLTDVQRRQWSQILLTLRVDPAAKRLALDTLPEPPLNTPEPCADLSTATDICSLIENRVTANSLAFYAEASHEVEMYAIDVAVRTGASKGPFVAVLFDIPSDPSGILKQRHLEQLGWKVLCLPVSTWREMTEDGRRDFVDRVFAE